MPMKLIFPIKNLRETHCTVRSSSINFYVSFESFSNETEREKNERERERMSYCSLPCINLPINSGVIISKVLSQKWSIMVKPVATLTACSSSSRRARAAIETFALQQARFKSRLRAWIPDHVFRYVFQTPMYFALRLAGDRYSSCITEVEIAAIAK